MRADKPGEKPQPDGPMNKETNIAKLIKNLTQAKPTEVKLGLDLHARDVVVCIQLDGSQPLRAQRMSHEQLQTLVAALLENKIKVHSLHEAGPCGYSLHRALTRLGANNHVITPRPLADGRAQKTDALDAAALLELLERRLRGNKRAFTPNRVPTEKEERARSQTRTREALKSDRHRWEARGRSLMLYHGYHTTGAWWKKNPWKELEKTLPDWLLAELQTSKTLIEQLDALETQHRQTLEAQAPKDLPKAIGALTWVMLAREICDWSRFKNRRQVSSYTGLCPGGYQTGGTKKDGHINRCGNPRVRHLLIELVWRLVRWQPDYPPVKKLVENTGQGAIRRKQAVAAARKLAVDLWRLATQQTTAEKLHLIMQTNAG